MEAFSGYAEEFKEVWRHPRKFVTSVLNLGCVVFSALMLWKLLMVTTGTESPVVVVMSGSMEPGFHRGDILFLAMTNAPMKSGDVTVFSIEGRDIPIVHRTLNVHDADPLLSSSKTPLLAGLVKPAATSETVAVLTKGDNNNLDDRGLYNRGQTFLTKKNIMGRAYGIIPYAGIITIWLNDYPWLKIAVIVWMIFFVMIERD
jgi:signal peptidase